MSIPNLEKLSLSIPTKEVFNVNFCLCFSLRLLQRESPNLEICAAHIEFEECLHDLRLIHPKGNYKTKNKKELNYLNSLLIV